MAISEIIEKENCRRVLKVEVPASEVKAEFDKIYQGLIKNASLPGFRKGKVPLNIIKTRFVESVKAEAIRNLITSSLYEAIKEKNLEILTEPLVEKGDLFPEQPFSYKATMEVRPEIKIGSYTGLKLTKRIKEITQEDIDKTLKDIQERFSRYTTVEGKDLSSKDYAMVDIKITRQGKEEVNREGIIIHIDDEGFGRGFTEKVKGLKKGEERGFVLNVPIREGDKELEKDVNIWLRLRDIKEKHPTPINDELAMDAGFDTLDQLKKDIEKRLATSEELRVYHEMRIQIDGHLLNIGDLVPPETVLKKREEGVLKEIEHDMELNGRRDEYKDREEDLKKDIQENNLKRVKLAYLLDEVGRKENIEVSREEVEEDLKSIFGEDKERLRRAREKLTDEKAWEDYSLRIREKKIYQYLINKAEVQYEKL